MKKAIFFIMLALTVLMVIKGMIVMFFVTKGREKKYAPMVILAGGFLESLEGIFLFLCLLSFTFL